CSSSISNAITVAVNPPFVPTAAANPTTICLGQSFSLSATGYATAPFTTEGFENNPAGWKSDGGNMNAGNNNSQNNPWNITGYNKTINGNTFPNPPVVQGGKFAITSGLQNSILTTPVFSLAGMTSASLQFLQALKLGAGGTAKIEISTNGSSGPWTALQQYTGVTTVGSPSSFSSTSVDLNNYLGLSNLQIRFVYNGTNAPNDFWGLDNVGISGPYQSLTYLWSGSGPGGYTYTSNQQNPGSITPTTAGTYSYTVSATSSTGCVGTSNSVSVTVNPLPTATISGTTGVCAGQSATISVALTGTGPWSITYSNGAASTTVNNIASSPYTFTVTPGNTITYTLTVVSDKNCTGTTSGSAVITVNSLPIVSTSNSCVGGGTVTFTQSGGAAGGTWSVSGGGSINPSTGLFTPTTAGCFTATYNTPTTPACSNTKSFVVFPAAPVLVAPANTCNTAFTLPTVSPVTGFTVQYSIDGGTSWSTTPTISATPGCYSIQARYALTSACGTTPANTPSTCVSNVVNVVIFPTAPSAPTVNSGCGAITVTVPPTISGFTIQYSFDDGTTWGANTPPTADDCIGYKIRVRYVTSSACGSIAANTANTISGCDMSPATLRKVDNTKPAVTCPTVPPACEVASGTYTIPPLTTSDNCSSSLTITYDVKNSSGVTIRSGSGVNASGTFNVGTSTITWTVKDECGNTNTCTTQVTIYSKPTPTIYHN
ncbi:MAG: hypothetical protein J7497_09770, partial [Chitinophagaceae bacterium]|nr:hypothetical protein [Chitinophagaceae bacterium]